MKYLILGEKSKKSTIFKIQDVNSSHAFKKMKNGSLEC